jgi:hypothetical protein
MTSTGACSCSAHQERQVDVFPGKGLLVGPAEQQQCLGEVDRPGVDGAEALVELLPVVVRVAAGDFEQCLCDRQRGAQLVGSAYEGEYQQQGQYDGCLGSESVLET